VMPSFVNTLPRCHSTIRGLMYSWAAISWLVCPSRASLAIWAGGGAVQGRVTCVPDWQIRGRDSRAGPERVPFAGLLSHAHPDLC